MNHAHGIIPARYASSRLPGKPLLLLHGKPMFWHVWHQASLCQKLSSVTLATDDCRIAEAAKQWNVPVVMTSEHHQSGTDRVYEATQLLNLPPESVVVNIQGDEPALNPHMVSELLSAFADPSVQAATLAHTLGWDEAQNPNKVKVVQNLHGDALYFSRARLPFLRDEASCVPCLGHIGLYAFTQKTLARFVTFSPSPLERVEKLEQLRFLEHGIPMRIVLTTHISHGVDVFDDVERILPLIQQT